MIRVETVNAGEKPRRRAGARRARHFALRLARLVRGRRGVTAVEFALIAPACITLFCVLIDLSMVMFITNVMEGGLREASRYAITGALPVGMTREDRIKQIVYEHSYNLIAQSDITVTYKVYGDFTKIGQPEPYTDVNRNGQYDAGEPFVDVNNNGVWDSDQGKAGPGGPGDIVAYTVSYKWVLWTPFAAEIWGNGGAVTLSATVAVRNEPY